MLLTAYLATECGRFYTEHMCETPSHLHLHNIPQFT